MIPPTARTKPRDLILREYADLEAILSPEEAGLIRRELGGRLDILPAAVPDLYVLRSAQYVGFVVMPSGRTIEIRPKCDVDVLFAMLSKVHHLADFEPDLVSYSSVRAWFEFIAGLFVGMVEDLAARGILRSFEECQADLQALRGKLLLAETLRHRPVVRDRHWCAYTEFTADILENRVLKLTCHALLAYSFTQVPDLPRRIRRLLRTLAQVELDRWAAERLGHLVYHRLNEHYRPALTLAQLLLSYLSFSGARGAQQFLSFLVDMNVLFEQYITAVLREAMISEPRWLVAAQDSRPLDMERKVTVRPDVVLYRETVPVVALDAKYKLAEHNADIYQALAYCHALGTDQTILAYPASEQVAVLRHRIRPDAVSEVMLLPIDLSGGIADLRRQTRAFSDAVWREALAWSRHGPSRGGTAT